MLRSVLLTLTFTTLAAPALRAQDNTWPRDIVVGDKGTITVYQPQPESLKGNLLSGRAAISMVGPKSREPVFGAMWYQATLEADNDSRTALLTNIKVTRVTWPNATEADQREFTRVVEEAALERMEISLDRLQESLKGAEVERKNAEGLKNDPPKIVVSEEVAVLLTYDGEPRTQKIPNTSYEQVVNTSMAVVKAGSTYYLSGGKIWYSATSPMGPWKAGAKPPADLLTMVPKDTSSTPAPSPAPTVVVATEPTELVVTDGPPRWKPIGDGSLLYVENTETPIVRQVDPAGLFILLSGRWFRATGLNGPWTFVRPDQIPATFAENISADSDLSGVRASIPGTDEAEDAMVDAAIPQTAAIKRSEAKLEVSYDGEPQFQDIPGTKVAYAVNTGSQVVRIEGKYYAVDNAVWFTSGSAKGPWVVADAIPTEEIKQIPPSAPVYNITDVEIFGSTPEVVYVGYYPGYMYSYPYFGVPFYGTGWYYRPYWGPGAYYPRPPSWGFHVGYNPWSGWSFGFSWSVGFMRIGMSFGGGYGGYYRPGWGYRPGYGGWGGGWYGPGGYRPPTCVGCTINIGGGHNNINIGNRVNVGNKIAAGNRTGVRRDAGLGRDNLYNRPETRNRVADRSTASKATRDLNASRVAKGKSNNVFADKDGNIHRRTDQGWETRDKSGWKPDPTGRQPVQRPEARPSTPARPEARPTTPSRPEARPTTPTTRPAPKPATRPSYNPSSGLERDYRARVNGATKASRPQPRPTTRPSRPASRPAPRGRSR